MPRSWRAAAPTSLYSWIDHTAELELHIEADSAEAVFRDAFAALVELLDDEQTGPPARHDVALEERDLAALLVQWLEELVFLAESDGFVAESVKALTFCEGGLQATVEGRRGSVRHLVKAVTYHGLSLERTNSTWHARVVLDV